LNERFTLETGTSKKEGKLPRPNSRKEKKRDGVFFFAVETAVLALPLGPVSKGKGDALA